MNELREIIIDMLNEILDYEIMVKIYTVVKQFHKKSNR